MEILAVWLIHHKASMTLDSPMNLDGSEYMVGMGVVPASNMQEALQLFERYLKKQDMAALEIWKCEQYLPENFTDTSQKNNEINEVAKEALNTTRFFMLAVCLLKHWIANYHYLGFDLSRPSFSYSCASPFQKLSTSNRTFIHQLFGCYLPDLRNRSTNYHSLLLKSHLRRK